MNERLNKLTVLAHMIKEAELGKLSVAEAARLKIRKEADLLRSKRRAALAGDGSDITHLSGTAGQWQDWCTDKLTNLATTEALAAAKAEAQKRVAARAFGRSMAIDKLAERAAMANARKKQV